MKSDPGSDLINRLADIIGLTEAWIANLASLLPTNIGEARRMWDAPAPVAVEDKFLAEAATLLHVVAQLRFSPLWQSTNLGAAWNSAFAALAAKGRPNRHQYMLGRFPHVAWPLGIPHAVLRRHGNNEEQFDRLFIQCLRLGWMKRIDRPTYREMEIRWADSIYKGTEPVVDDLFKASSIEKALPAIMARREDVYAFTHVLFYATDFGACALPEYANVEQIAGHLDNFLAWRLKAGDLDLVVELVAAAECAEIPSRYSAAALNLIWPEVAYGVARGPNAPDDWNCHSDPLDPMIFGAGYHTTLVTGILLATLLVRDKTMAQKASLVDVKSLNFDGETISAFRAGDLLNLGRLIGTVDAAASSQSLDLLAEALTIRETAVFG